MTNLYARIPGLDTDSLRMLVRHYGRLSAQARDNPRSTYHRYYYRAWAELCLVRGEPEPEYKHEGDNQI